MDYQKLRFENLSKSVLVNIYHFKVVYELFNDLEW